MAVELDTLRDVVGEVVFAGLRDSLEGGSLCPPRQSRVPLPPEPSTNKSESPRGIEWQANRVPVLWFRKVDGLGRLGIRRS